MQREHYDIVTIGGGLGGAALAMTMAARGARVLVLERTREFKDRVRGEVLVPWGCLEARALGLYDRLAERCGHQLRFWDADLDGMPIMHRDLVTTTLSRVPIMTFFHPSMQTEVLHAAAEAGADVRQGTTVTEVVPGAPPVVTFEADGTHRAEARLVVGADGRGSRAREWGAFATRSDPPRRLFTGVLMDRLTAPEDTLHSRFSTRDGAMSWLFPQGGGRVRAYLGLSCAVERERLQGAAALASFVERSIALGVPATYFEHAEMAGPLATFDATDNWVDHPYRDGIALVGDAAATSDPTWGQGMAHTLRDVRVLAEKLAAHDDWNAAGDAYAREHDRGREATHTCDGWYTDLLLGIGPDADARRARALPRVAADPSRLPDTPFDGPEITPDERARRRLYGEE